jgi:hypothetical protein
MAENVTTFSPLPLFSLVGIDTALRGSYPLHSQRKALGAFSNARYSTLYGEIGMSSLRAVVVCLLICSLASGCASGPAWFESSHSAVYQADRHGDEQSEVAHIYNEPLSKKDDGILSWIEENPVKTSFIGGAVVGVVILTALVLYTGSQIAAGSKRWE